LNSSVSGKDDSVVMRAMETKDVRSGAHPQNGTVTTEVVGLVAEYLTSREVREDEVLLKEDGDAADGGRCTFENPFVGGGTRRGTSVRVHLSIGRDAGVPHSSGNPGDLIQLGQTIVFDIYPAEAGGGYYYDFTRTWSLGYATPEAQELYDQVKEIFDRLTDNYDLNASFKEYQRMTCEFFESKGHAIPAQFQVAAGGIRPQPRSRRGLNIHERPFSNLLAKTNP
jgi:Xaa-Pro aminopeptidase